MALLLWDTLRRIVLTICLVTPWVRLVTGNGVRLHGGSSDDMGTVQINVEGEWKYICNGDWDILDALVVCRELGFANGYAMLLSDQDYDYWDEAGGSESTVIIVTEEPDFQLAGYNFDCNGTEQSLLSCINNREFASYCSKPARVACGVTGAKFKELITRDGDLPYYDVDEDYFISDTSSGHVLATHRSHHYSSEYSSEYSDVLSGGICNINERAASLICKKYLGYINGGTAIQVPAISNLPMLLSELSCSVYDDSVYYCHKIFTTDGICPEGVQFNGVKCYTSLISSVIGALAFAGVSCIFLILAGAVAIHWIRRKAKTPNSRTIDLTVHDQCGATPGQLLQQST